MTALLVVLLIANALGWLYVAMQLMRLLQELIATTQAERRYLMDRIQTGDAEKAANLNAPPRSTVMDEVLEMHELPNGQSILTRRE